jgi:hypothetical protein
MVARLEGSLQDQDLSEVVRTMAGTAHTPQPGNEPAQGLVALARLTDQTLSTRAGDQPLILPPTSLTGRAAEFCCGHG